MQNFNGYPVALDASVKTTNPTTSDILADTGALAAGMYEARVLVGASAAAIFAVQRRNAANDANVGDVVVIYCGAGVSVQHPLRMQIEPNERIRVTMEANLTGTGAAAIMAQRCG